MAVEGSGAPNRLAREPPRRGQCYLGACVANTTTNEHLCLRGAPLVRLLLGTGVCCPFPWFHSIPEATAAVKYKLGTLAPTDAA